MAKNDPAIGDEVVARFAPFAGRIVAYSSGGRDSLMRRLAPEMRA